MLRGLRWAAVAAFLSIQGGAISAQYYYPPGYASAGWGGWGGGWGGDGMSQTSVQHVDVGTLMLDMYDNKTDRKSTV